jgi:hypothetical protein
MIEILPDSRGTILGIRATGKLTDKDYQEVLIPALEGIIRDHGRARFLCHMDKDFDGLEMGAMWDDAKLFLKHKSEFEKMAVVGGRKWIEVMVKLFAHFMVVEVRTFPDEQLQEAWEWIKV